MKRPYIPQGCTQQGRVVPTLAQRARNATAAAVARHIIADDPDDAPGGPAGIPAPDPAAGRAWAIYAATLLLVAIGFALSGCGGGDDEPTAGTHPVDCRATPELCR